MALREVRALPQTFLYFLAYFLLADGLNTTGMPTSNSQTEANSVQDRWWALSRTITSPFPFST